MKKKLMLMLIILSLLLTGCGKEEQNKKKKEETNVVEKNNKDALKFKKDYESINGEKIQGTEYVNRTISIKDTNPFIYSSMGDILKKIEDKETFYVYFGFAGCPWCRSAVPTMIESAETYGVDTIYYVNVRPDNTKDSDLRGYKDLDENNKVVTTIEADKNYHKLLEHLNSKLTDYELSTENGKKIKTGEKRLYAPTLVAFENGKMTELTRCNSDKQTDGFMELSNEMIEDMKDNFKTIFTSGMCTEDKC